MFVKNIKLNNFKNFIHHEENFEKLVFIKGKNGTGKTTLTLDAILFVLYGYSIGTKLANLPNKSNNKECEVEITLTHKNNQYIMVRKYPTSLQVFKNEKEEHFNTASEAQNYIDNLFGDRKEFLQFRIADAYSKESSILDAGQTAFKSILLHGSESIFNSMRKELNSIKRNREIYNKDNLNIEKYYPSLKRLNIVKAYLDMSSTENSSLRRSYELLRADMTKTSNRVSNTLNDINRNKANKSKVINKKKCYVCNNELSEKQKKELIEALEKENLKLGEDYECYRLELDCYKEELTENEKELQVANEKINRIRELKYKLEYRIKQKEYVYSTNDVDIAKKSIKLLDLVSSKYLIQKIGNLEPLINSIINKINFKIKILLDSSNKVMIKLYKEKNEYDYQELSTGQKLILQIAFKVAMLMQKDSTGIIIADEGLSSLDRENLDHILSIFYDLPFQVFFVIHNLENINSDVQIINLGE